MKLLKNIFNKEKMKSNKGKISEWSYQRFSNFFDNVSLPEPEFDNKINSIISTYS